MKKLNKILVVALALALLVCAFALTVGAAEEPEFAFEVRGNGYNTWAEAYAAAQAGDTIALLKDYTFLESDYTDGLSYYDFTLKTESGKSSPANPVPDKKTTKGILIDKEITLHLGTSTLASDLAVGGGIVFYVNTDGLTFTITGGGKLTSAVPVLVISRGDAVISGGNAGMTIEYTGTKLIPHIHVGNLERNNVDSNGNNKGINGKTTSLTVTGRVNFHATGTVTILDGNGSGTAYPISTGGGWAMNVNWYSAIAVSVHQKLNIQDAEITNTASGSARSLITWDPMQSYNDNYNTKINVTDSEIVQNADAPIMAAGATQASYVRRATITINNSRLEATVSSTEHGMIQTGRMNSGRTSGEIIANNSSFYAVGKMSILYSGGGTTKDYGNQTAAIFTNCFLL